MTASIIFSPALNTFHHARRRNHHQSDRPTANAAILNVLLPPDRAINNHLDLLAAIWTLNKFGLKILHDPTFGFHGLISNQHTAKTPTL